LSLYVINASAEIMGTIDRKAYFEAYKARTPVLNPSKTVSTGELNNKRGSWESI